MGMVSFSVHSEGLEDIKEKMNDACTEAEHALAVQIRSDTSQFVPMLTGSLDSRTRIEGTVSGGFGPGGGNKIVYPGPYARYLYYGKVMIDPTIGAAGFQLKDGTWRSKKGVKKVLTEKPLKFNKSFHPQAQARWFEASKAQNLDKWIRVADKAVKHEF